MAFPLVSPVTGGLQTGFAAPTYSIAADSPPANNCKQFFVFGLGGTQAGVTVHSATNPFTVAMWKPLNFKTLTSVNPITGLLQKVPVNTYKVVVRKGVTPLAGQPVQVMTITCHIDVPAGADTADAQNVRAAMSVLIGSMNQMSSGVGDTLIYGTL